MPGTEGDRKIDPKNNIDDIIYPEIEPGIISKQMIENAYIDDGKKGEEARLHKLEPVVFDRIQTLRLEYKNILRIDHLWMLTNLTKLSLNSNKIETIEHIDMLINLRELNLSFNYIEKIENLDKLINIEVLSLFSNRIEKLENIDALEKLVIFSIGNNKIETVQGIERLRFLKDLKVLNLEGNPIAKKPDFSLSKYIAAVLPNVKYYEYVLIKDEFREQAKGTFARELREIENNEEVEIIERQRIAKEKRDAERLASSFVEHLNEHQLYESLWKGDEDGRVLMLVGQPAADLAEEYDKDIFDITQEIYKFGLEQFEERENEITQFMASLEEGQNDIQHMGHQIIEAYLKDKESVFEQATKVLRRLEIRHLQGEEEDSPESTLLSDQFRDISLDFEDHTHFVWQQLMNQELHLHESVEEATLNFQRKIQEMMSKFVEHAQTYFGQLRDIALHFSEHMTEIVSEYINQKLALQDFDDVPPELMLCMEERDAVMNLVAGMKEIHVLRIDEREDRLMKRSAQFVDDLIDNLIKDELQRNREKILEINTFLETSTESLHNLPEEIREILMNEDV